MKAREYRVREVPGSELLPGVILESGETNEEALLFVDDLRKKGYNKEDVKYCLEIDGREIFFGKQRVKNLSEYFSLKNEPE